MPPAIGILASLDYGRPSDDAPEPIKALQAILQKVDFD